MCIQIQDNNTRPNCCIHSCFWVYNQKCQDSNEYINTDTNTDTITYTNTDSNTG